MRGAGRRGFTLVETVISVALIGVGVVAAFSALAAIENAYYRTRGSEVIQRLTVEKYNEIVATGEWSQAPLSGVFEHEDFSWTAETTPSGFEYATTLRVTVRPQTGGGEPFTIAGIVFAEPINGGAILQ